WFGHDAVNDYGKNGSAASRLHLVFSRQVDLITFQWLGGRNGLRGARRRVLIMLHLVMIVVVGFIMAQLHIVDNDTEKFSPRVLDHLYGAPRHIARIAAMLDHEDGVAYFASHNGGITDAKDWRRVVQDDIK